MPELQTKQAQDAEAFQRAQQRGTATPDAVSPPVADTVVPDDLPAPRPEAAAPAAEQVTEKVAPAPREDRRAAIVARFRQTRDTSDASADADELRQFANNGIPPELSQPPTPAPTDATPVDAAPPANNQVVIDQEPEPAPAPAKKKLVVRGKEFELTDEEMAAAAQRGLAGDDYLDESKRKLNEVNDLLRTTRAASTSPAATHPGAPTNGQTAEPSPAPAPTEDSEHPENPLSNVVQQIQFGDPAEAAVLLERTIEQAAARRSVEALRNERVRNEAIRSSRMLKEFEGQHPELAKDEFATAAMEKHLYNLQRSDLVELAKSFGHDETQIPTDPKTVASWHLYYRTEGHPVRDVPTLLKTARDDFLKWKGPSEQPAPQPRQAEPRVEVAVNRSQRREAIPQQPTRTVTPKPDAIVQPAPVRDRSAIVRDMVAARAKPRGRVVGI